MKSIKKTKNIVLLLLSLSLCLMPSRKSLSDPSAVEILQKCRNSYTSLRSYSDEGVLVINWSKLVLTTPFKIKMSRPSLYRVSWQGADVDNVVWNSGLGDFISRGNSVEDEEKEFRSRGITDETKVKQLSQENVLSVDEYVTLIPSIFFNVLDRNPLSPSLDEKLLRDEATLGVSCYVVQGSLPPNRTVVLWIGKSDFLIRQIRTIKKRGSNDNELPANQSGLKEPAQIVSTETHSNIIVNKQFSNADFLPK